MLVHQRVSHYNTSIVPPSYPHGQSPEKNCLGSVFQDIAAADPTAIIRTPVDIIDGINPAAAEKMAIEMGFTGAQEGVLWIGFFVDGMMNDVNICK